MCDADRPETANEILRDIATQKRDDNDDEKTNNEDLTNDDNDNVYDYGINWSWD